MEERVELELELESDGQGGFRVSVRSSAGDGSAGPLVLDAAELLSQRAHLQATLLASAVSSRAAVSELEAPVRRVGETLFRGLFGGEAYAAYKASLAVAAERGTQLRVVLRTQVPELAAMPWETLYDPDSGAYLCQREPLVRHVSVSGVTRPLTVTPPLRILGVVAAPTDRPRLDVDGEKQRLAAALSPLGSRVQLRWVDGGRWADVQRELLAGSWHVLHFVGHGGFDEARGEGALVLEDDERHSDLVGADRFGDLLTLQVPPLQLVVLNSCAGGQSAADDLFSSTAATLVRTGVSAVVAMQFAVSDPAAKAFAAGFYQAIAHDRSIAEAVRIGRIGIRGTGAETLEWITPALYLRGGDAPLFTVLPDVKGPAASEPELPPEVAARLAGAQALYQQAMSRLRADQMDDALALFDSLLALQPDFRDAASRREHTARRIRARQAWEDARSADARGDTATAVAGYRQVLDLDPDHPDAREELERGLRALEVAALQDELRAHVAAEDWAAAVAVADDLERLSPEDADPDGLASTAREKLQEETTPPPSRLRYVWGAVGAAVLVTAVAIAWSDGSSPGGGQGPGGGDVPAPFESAALYDLVRHHFDPAGCRVPESKSDAPLAWDLPHTELLRCDQPGYSGALLCTANHDDLLTVRGAYLSFAVGQPEPVTETPAGRSEPFPFQVSFNHRPHDEGRVFWDDDQLCAAEMQVSDTDLGVVIGHFVTGLDS